MKSFEITALDTDLFLKVLAVLPITGLWDPWIGRDTLRGIIRLRRRGGHGCYSPRTAVHYHLTDQEIENCFWLPEFTERFGFPWSDNLAIAYAEDACDCSRQYDRNLRDRILLAIGLPMEHVPEK